MFTILKVASDLIIHKYTEHTRQKERYVGLRGGTDIESGYGDLQPWNVPPPLSCVIYKGPI